MKIAFWILVAVAVWWFLTRLGDGMKLSVSQIREFARNAGFTGTDLDIATAIALAESSGKTTAYNPETAAGAAPGKGSYGLWQIYTTAHPEFSPAQLQNPQENANAAFAVFKAAGYQFTPWSTFKNGAYRRFLDLIS